MRRGMPDTDDWNASVEALKSIQDPSEFISTCRQIGAAQNGRTVDEMFPLTDDEAGDVILHLLGVWIAMRGTLPFESREQVAAMATDMARMLEKMKGQIPDNPESRKGLVMRCLRWLSSILQAEPRLS
jgi:hypothetical protein